MKHNSVSFKRKALCGDGQRKGEGLLPDTPVRS
jgi:hypothetical protein